MILLLELIIFTSILGLLIVGIYWYKKAKKQNKEFLGQREDFKEYMEFKKDYEKDLQI